MANKKPKFPSKPCPKCGDLIHARSKQHEACGWVMPENGAKPSAAPRAGGKAKKRAARATASKDGGVSLDDIRAVKAVVDRLGADKVQELAAVLTK